MNDQLFAWPPAGLDSLGRPIHGREKDAGSAAGGDEGNSAAPYSGDMYVRSFHVRVMPGAEEGKRQVRVVASTPAEDRYEEIVEQSWILDQYLVNPTVLWAHQSRDLPIGFSTDVGVVDGNLESTLNFVDEKANPKGPQVYEGFKQGSIRAVSVGFYPRDIRMEKRNGKEVFVLSNNVLLEISPCTIPANPEALAKQSARIRERAMGINLSAAERGEEKKSMDEKTKAALDAEKARADAAEQKAKDAEQKAKDLETSLASEKALRLRATAALVRAFVEAGRFGKDELEEQTELAAKDFELFERLAAKRTIRGTEIVGAEKIGPPGADKREDGNASTSGSDDFNALVLGEKG